MIQVFIGILKKRHMQQEKMLATSSTDRYEIFSEVIVSQTNKINCSTICYRTAVRAGLILKTGITMTLDGGLALLVPRGEYYAPDSNIYTESWNTFKYEVKHWARFFDFEGAYFDRAELPRPNRGAVWRVDLNPPRGNIPLARAYCQDRFAEGSYEDSTRAGTAARKQGQE